MFFMNTNIRYIRNNKNPTKKDLYQRFYKQIQDKQDKNAELKTYFTPIASTLTANEAKIDKELIEAQGKKQEIGGYYQPNESLLNKAMRPSDTLNAIINKM